MKKILLLCLLGLLMNQVWAQTEEGSYVISTDRPSFSYGGTLPKKIFQAELGYYGYRSSYDLFGGGKVSYRYNALGNAMLRYGLLDQLEVRLGWGGYATSKYKVDNDVFEEREGRQALIIGTKLRLLKGEGNAPEMSFLAQVTLPSTAGPSFSYEGANVEFLAILSKQLGGISLFSNIGLMIEVESYHYWLASLGANKALNEKLSMYAEVAPRIEIGDGVYTFWPVNIGATYLINNRNQLDLAVGSVLNNSADDYFVNIGWSFYLGK